MRAGMLPCRIPKSPASGRGMSRQVLSGTGLSQASSRSFAVPAGNHGITPQEYARMGNGGRERKRCRASLEMIPLFGGRSTDPQSGESGDGMGISARTDGENRLKRSGSGHMR